MIKKFKIFENTGDEPKIGDYVICRDSVHMICPSMSIDINIFLEKNIGKVIDYNDTNKYDYDEDYKFIVYFEDCPSKLKAWFTSNMINGEVIENIRAFSLKEILYWTDNEEDAKIMLEIITKGMKYNI